MKRENGRNERVNGRSEKQGDKVYGKREGRPDGKDSGKGGRKNGSMNGRENSGMNGRKNGGVSGRADADRGSRKEGGMERRQATGKDGRDWENGDGVRSSGNDGSRGAGVRMDGRAAGKSRDSKKEGKNGQTGQTERKGKSGKAGKSQDVRQVRKGAVLHAGVGKGSVYPDAGKDAGRDVGKGERRDAGRDGYKGAGKGAGRDGYKSAGKGADRDGYKSAGKGADRDGYKGAGKGADRDGYKSAEKGADKNGYVGKGKGSSRDAGKGMGKDVGKPSLCAVSKECGGCQWIDVPYEEQLKRKQKMLDELCGGYVRFEKIIGMKEPRHYRNKVSAVFGEDKRHNPISGIYEEKTHHIVPVNSCLLENRKADQIIVSVRGLLKSFKIRPYNEDSGYGLLRHVMIRTGHATGQIMVVLVLASPILPSKNNFAKALLNLHPEITTIVVNVNPRGTSMVMGNKEQVIYGKGYIEDELCGMTFRISPRSFYQVNPVQAEKLYNKAIEYAGLTGKETVLDAYCGTGTIGMIASKKAGKVIGVELNGDAVKDARMNAKENGVKNIEFWQQDAGEFMMRMAENDTNVDVVLMDPPRTGSDEAFLGALVRMAPRKVVYVSCNPETLDRDLRYLKGKGYEVVKGVGVDMFGFTRHVETVILLSRKTPDAVIDINLDMSELDITSAESKATYEEIRAYMKNKYDLNVTNLYIAQVKQEYGIIERQNYNVSKKDIQKVPKVTLEKRTAIIDALKYFQMI